MESGAEGLVPAVAVLGPVGREGGAGGRIPAVAVLGAAAVGRPAGGAEAEDAEAEWRRGAEVAGTRGVLESVIPWSAAGRPNPCSASAVLQMAASVASA